MNWVHLFFGFDGRINRAKIWLSMPVYSVMAISIVIAAGPPWRYVHIPPATVFVVSYLAVVTKRLHDLNKSAMWLVIYVLLPAALAVIASMAWGGDISMAFAPNVLSLVAGILNIWAFWELYCLPGTPGPNRYGPDPVRR